jgi:hypothetical protein
VLAPWFVRVHGIEVEGAAALHWVADFVTGLFG